MQLDADLTLEKAVNQARQKGAVHGQQSIVRSQIVNDNRLDFVKQKPKQQRTVKKSANRIKPKLSKCTRRCEGAVYLTSLGRPTDIGLQLGKACYP